MASLTIQFDGTGRLAMPEKLPVVLKVGDTIQFNEKTAKISMFKPNQIVCEVDGRYIPLTPEELAVVQKVTGGRKSRKTRKSRKNKSRRYRRV
jgi:ribosomal protein S6E (S10)